jgi:[protein-PII] uridylyltransferase
MAGIVKDQKNLTALMLLTLADGQGTSADAWSDWKESLVWQLFHATSQYLADQQSYHEQTKIERDTLQREITERLPPDYAEEIEAHFDFMPDNYFRAFRPPEIVDHLKLYRRFLEAVSTGSDEPLAPAMSWQVCAEQGHTVVRFWTWEREQLLAKSAGSFAIVPINILSADVFPRGDNVVLQIFHVCDLRGRAVTKDEDFRSIEAMLRRALEESDFDLAPLIEKTRREKRRLVQEIEFPTRIAIDNKAHPSYTLIQIQTPDRLGLLYDLLSCLDRAGMESVLSRISTQNGAAIDTFYVTDRATHGKITDLERISTLQKELQGAALGS